MSRPNVTPAWEGEDRRELLAVINADELLDLQCKVIQALEDANHPALEAAMDDNGLNDGATSSQKKAWLAIYGPLTNVL